ncbi:MAG: glycoside hydrolase family 9 protein [Spirochaetales bacterium]|nr:glycoside hydrolase family 9 protein [Spirochaetales bacterium]
MEIKNEKTKTIRLIFLLTVLIAASGATIYAEPRSGGSYYNYGEALQKAILFYKAQRSGDLPDDYILPYRADTCMDDGKDVGLDLTGGWFDAGDHVKFGMPMAYTAAQLGWGVYEYRDGFERAGLLDDILDEIKWALDYFIKCHPSANVYYYDCGDGESDHSCWVPPEVVHLFTERNSFKVDTSTPGSDVAGQAAAAMAIGSIIFEPTNPSYAATLLTHAEQLFSFADTYRGKYPLPAFYMSGGYLDDLTWAAVWLYIKTNNESYLDKALSYIPIGSLGGHHTHCWDDVSYGAVLKMTQITKDPEYVEAVEANLDWFLPGSGVAYSPGGLAYLSNWGALRYATTAAFLAFVWSDDDSVGTASKKATYREFAEKQLNYVLGDNPKGGSYMVGFGENPPQHPHHRTAHCSWLSMLDVPTFHRHILFGALVGGPDSNDIPNDDVRDYTLNEVADDYNAGFVGSLARMYSAYGGEPLAGWPQPEDFRPPEEEALTEYFVRGWIQWEGPSDVHVLFQVNNRSAWPPTVRSGMSARYFMDLSEVFNAGYSTGDIKLALKESDEGGSVSGLSQWAGDVYYFTVDFTGTLIHPGYWDKCEKEATVSISSPVTGGFGNDWSYQDITTNPDYDCKTFKGKTEYIPVYDNGVLLWGLEPPGGAQTAPPAATPTGPPGPTNPGSPTSPPSGVLGDVNDSGSIDIVDALLVAQYYVGLSPENFNSGMADANCDNTINIVDALLIARYYVGLIDELC